MRTHASSTETDLGKAGLFVAVLIWSLLVLASLFAQREQLNRTAEALARIDAVTNLRKDMAVRKWASQVGGIYINEAHIPPIDSMSEEERLTVTRNTGETLHLVSITPIHLLLAIQATSNKEFGIKERLTSNQLRNLDNNPDEWETKALAALKDGSSMVAEALPKKGSHGLMRVMIPMKMEEECLECHRDTLVPVGGLRGGAVISIDLNAYRTAQEPTWRAIQYWHLAIWILGLTALFSFDYFKRHRNLERRRQEEERRENAMAFAAMAEGAVITDPQGTILWVNDAFCQIYGYQPEEVIGQNPRLLKSGLHDQAFYEGLWQHLAQEGHWRGEIWNRRKNGEIFPEELSIQALRGPEGEPRRYISVFSDITERKRNEQELQAHREHLEDLVAQRTRELTEARNQAEAANQSKSAFLANMSHELRTPLNAVIGFSQLMARDEGLNDRQQRNVGIINSSGKHLLTLINDVLELSKIESGKMEMRPEETDLPDLLEQVVAMMRVRAEEAGLDLRLALDEVPGAAVIDPVMLRQVLLNLLSNAIKFTPAGEVCLLVSGRPDGPSRCLLDFQVRDTGIGIADADQALIFRPFEQAGGNHQGGTGLGLTISRQYVAMMGGELRVDSIPGQGSVFHFTLPVAAVDAPPRPAPRSESWNLAPADHGHRILVVDNAPEARLLLRSLLEPVGFAIREAANAGEALAEAEQWQPELVFLDWFLGPDKGLDVMARLKNSPRLPHPKVVILTANALSESRDEAQAAGADDFLSKPYQASDLYRIAAQQLDLDFTPTAPPPSRENRPEVAPVDLSTLPPALRQQLTTAALTLNAPLIGQALAALAREAPELAEQLSQAAASKQYRQLWQLLDLLDESES